MYQEEFWLFVVIVLVVLLAYVLLKLKNIAGIKKQFSGAGGRGILAGIFTAVIAIPLIGSLIFFSKPAAAGEWFNYQYVYLGIDSTLAKSPQCIKNNVDEHGTSNLGAGANLWRDNSKNVHVNFEYTHHSCVIAVDEDIYDAFGVKAVWFFNRK